MIFRRTDSGIKNQSRFFGVDLMVYIEGIRDARPRLALADGQAQSMDAIFWSQIVGGVLGDIKLHFKELGSKKALLDFSSGLSDEVKGTVAVCADRDFDDLFDFDRAQYKCLVRTWSYSWESEVWDLAGVLDAVGALLPVDAIPEAEIERLTQAWDDFYRGVTKHVAIDAKAVRRGYEAVLLRCSPSAVVLVDRDSPPMVNKRFLKARLASLRRECGRPFSESLSGQVDARRHLYGKSAMAFGYQMVISSLRFLGVPTQFSLEAATSFSIRLFGARLRAGLAPNLTAHYKAEFEAAGYEVRAVA